MIHFFFISAHFTINSLVNLIGPDYILDKNYLQWFIWGNCTISYLGSGNQKLGHWGLPG